MHGFQFRSQGKTSFHWVLAYLKHVNNFCCEFMYNINKFSSNLQSMYSL